MSEYAATDQQQGNKPPKLSPSSGRFELDAQGWTRWYPPETGEKNLAYYDRWIGDQIDRMLREHEPRFTAAAENIETYAATTLPVKGMSETAIVPSDLARTAAKQTTANLINAGLRPRPIISFDAYFHALYPVLVSVTAAQVREKGVNLDSSIPDDATLAAPYEIDAETLSHVLEQHIEYLNRERLDFQGNYARLVHDIVRGSTPSYWVVQWTKRSYTKYAPRSMGMFVDLSHYEEDYGSEGCLHERIEPYYNVLQSNIDQPINEQDIVALRDPWAPGLLLAQYADKQLFLLKDDEDAEKLAKKVTTEPVADESRRRTDATTRHWTPEQRTGGECDVYDVSFFADVEVDEGDDRRVTRKMLFHSAYHYGAKRCMNLRRWEYRHGRRNIVPFAQFLDGSSTVEDLKHKTQLHTHLAQSEVKSAWKANNPQRWMDPQSPNKAYLEALDGKEVGPDTAIMGVAGKDFGYERGAFEHYSLLNHLQWIETSAMRAAKQGYGTGDPVVSHTSPTTVDRMLERSDQGELLTLRLIDRGIAEVIRLRIETLRQFNPLGEYVPVRDPVKKAIVRLPMIYPVEDILNNFRITFTAADIAIAQERDAAQQAQALAMNQQYATFMAQVNAGVLQLLSDGQPLSPDMKEEVLKFYLRTAKGQATLYDSTFSAIRTDEENVDLLEPMENVINRAIDNLRQQQLTQPPVNGEMNVPQTGNQLPAAEPGADAGGSVGAGAQPGMAGGAQQVAGAVNPEPAPGG